MIPFILAAVGGYLIGDSMKDSNTFAKGGLISVKGKKYKLEYFIDISLQTSMSICFYSMRLIIVSYIWLMFFWIWVLHS